MSPVELAAHEWSPAPSPTDASAAARVAVLVHGVTGWHRTWWRVGPALAARGWRVLAVDQRGHGHSPRVSGASSIGDLADDLGAAIERIGAPVDALIGHSLGAAVSADLVDRRPELVRRLVLEDPPGIIRAGDDDWLSEMERGMLAAHDDPEGEVARRLEANPTWLEGDARQDVEGRRLADREGIIESFRRGGSNRLVEIGLALRVPTLWILAAEDRSVFPPGARRALGAGLPAHSRIEIVDAGHSIHRDRFDAYLALVADWIERPL